MMPGPSSFVSFKVEDDDSILVYDGDDVAGRRVFLDESDEVHVPIGIVARVARRSALPWEATPSDRSMTYEKPTLEAAARRLYEHHRMKGLSG